jgi:hypothetical protein
MARKEEVKLNTEFTTNGISLVGHAKKKILLIGKSLNRHNNLFAAAKYTHCIFKMRSEHLVNMTIRSKPEITA